MADCISGTTEAALVLTSGRQNSWMDNLVDLRSRLGSVSDHESNRVSEWRQVWGKALLVHARLVAHILDLRRLEDLHLLLWMVMMLRQTPLGKLLCMDVQSSFGRQRSRLLLKLFPKKGFQRSLSPPQASTLLLYPTSERCFCLESSSYMSHAVASLKKNDKRILISSRWPGTLYNIWVSGVCKECSN